MRDVAVVVIAKQIDATLKQLIERVSWADQVIIVINNQTIDDQMGKIATSKVQALTRAWDGYANQKNFGIDQATTSWILSLDADEWLSQEATQQIAGLVDDPEVDGYYLPRQNYLGDRWIKYGGLYPDYQLRLFRKQYGRFEGVAGSQIHERVTIERAAYLTGSIKHLTYANWSDYWHKVQRYAADEGRAVGCAGQRPALMSWLSPVKRFVSVYVIQQGWRDGWVGMVNACFLSYYQGRKLLYQWRYSRKDAACA